MASNFNIKSMDETGAVIRILANNKLIDCRFPAYMPDDQRMGWLKNTANEYLVNIGRADLVVAVPTVMVDSGADPEQPHMVERYAPEANTDNLPETDEPDAQGFWARVQGWFS